MISGHAARVSVLLSHLDTSNILSIVTSRSMDLKSLCSHVPSSLRPPTCCTHTVWYSCCCWHIGAAVHQPFFLLQLQGALSSSYRGLSGLQQIRQLVCVEVWVNAVLLVQQCLLSRDACSHTLTPHNLCIITMLSASCQRLCSSQCHHRSSTSTWHRCDARGISHDRSIKGCKLHAPAMHHGMHGL